MAWWESIAPHSLRQVVLLQVDISGHSQWIETSIPRSHVARDRTDFANRLQEHLAGAPHRFDRLYWLGDGGLFAREFKDRSDADSVCPAADEVFETFRRWKKTVSTAAGLQLRVSACYVPDLDVHSEPGYWCSSRMNAFLKYERRFAHKEAFTITNELLVVMSSGSAYQDRFKRKLSVSIPTGEIVTAWVDKKHPVHVERDFRRFGKWLADQAAAKKLPVSYSLDANNLPCVGGSVVLESALSTEGFEKIEFIAGRDMLVQAEVDSRDQDAWREEVTKIGEVPGTFLSVTRVSGELTDHPVFRLWWRPAAFADVRGFQAICSNPATRQRYLTAAVMVDQPEGVVLPNALCFHIVVLLKNSRGYDVCIAHRKKAGRPGATVENRWSFGIEENFRPATYMSKQQKEVEPDTTPEEVVARAVKEELLGEDYDGLMRVSFHAFALETELYPNFIFLALAEITDTDFDRLAQLWSSAPDRDEHDAIAAIPLEKGILYECLKSTGLPNNVWLSANKRVQRKLQDSDHVWHPTSKMRMALALWFIEDFVASN